jgi:hypothetical protein
VTTTPVAELNFLEIEARLRTMTTTGSAHYYDLTDAGQVLVGEGIPQGIRRTTVSIAMTRIDTEDGAPLTERRRRLTVPVLAVVPATSKPRDKLLAAVRLASDIDRVITTLRGSSTLDRSLNGNALDVEVSLDAVTGDDYGFPGAAVVTGEITCYWEQERGL